jgi:dienelactone hydrolase
VAIQCYNRRDNLRFAEETGTLETRAIAYDCDGTKLTGYAADGAPHRRKPAILVAHEAFGMNDHIRARTRRLAELGYAAFALDMYGAEGFSLPQAVSRHVELMSAPGLMRARASAAFSVLTALPGVDPERTAAIGFCQGGITALELARGGAPVRCAVGFHPGLMRPAGSSDQPIRAKVLMMIGDQDPDVPPEDRAAFAAEMQAKRADWQLHLFGGVGHAYTNPDADRLNRPGYGYDAAADRRSWTMMLGLFEEVFEVGG